MTLGMVWRNVAALAGTVRVFFFFFLGSATSFCLSPCCLDAHANKLSVPCALCALALSLRPKVAKQSKGVSSRGRTSLQCAGQRRPATAGLNLKEVRACCGSPTFFFFFLIGKGELVN